MKTIVILFIAILIFTTVKILVEIITELKNAPTIAPGDDTEYIPFYTNDNEKNP
jgi:hypothetical protein